VRTENTAREGEGKMLLLAVWLADWAVAAFDFWVAFSDPEQMNVAALAMGVWMAVLGITLPLWSIYKQLESK
jgi:glycerol-3-phosphate acyltransferase PlsY